MLRKEQIERTFTQCKNDSTSWRVFFSRLYDSYGCVFFACCCLRLVDYFEMNKLLGASWYVKLSKLPDSVDGAQITSTLNGGGSSKTTRDLVRIYKQAYFMRNQKHGVRIA